MRIAHAEPDGNRHLRLFSQLRHACLHRIVAHTVRAGDAGKRHIVQKTLGMFADLYQALPELAEELGKQGR